ncbi:hypothetical protein GALL_127860 [mine drainage metagenome]|uniref:Uncharacterized protein n=1 Tax=mine drainage metagenome TaxID=410659 RepID=A0A1J5S9V9_9ZZZZ
MKYLIGILLLITNVAISQQPSQKDLQNAMKEYEKVMNDPQIKKMMKDSSVQKYMGKGKMPADSKQLQQQMNFAMQHVSQQQKNKLFGIETLPKKDVTRIAALPKTILTNQQFKTYLQKLKPVVQKKISAENRNTATLFLKQLPTNTDANPFNYSSAAVAWLNKANPQIALYVLAEAVTQPNLDVNDVNNFAVLLNINGGEHLALPILQKINVEYPNNSTILNNIGQAWFGLGDFNKSEKYIDSSLHLFAGNAQANYTKCYLELQKGNTQQAIEYLIKSIQNGYDPNKENKLKQLGKKLSVDDIKWNLPKPPDPLGLDSMLLFRPEDFYTDINGQNALNEKWKIFEKQVADAKQVLSNSFNDAANAYAKNFMQMMKHPPQGPIVANFMQRKAGKMADALTADFNDYMERMGKEKLEIFKDVVPDEMEIYKKLGAIKDAMGADYSTEKYCQAAIPLVDAFLEKYNPLVESYSADYIKHIKVYVSDMAYFEQFIDGGLNLYVPALKSLFLDALYSYPGRSMVPTAPVYFDLDANCVEHKTGDVFLMHKLPDFDEVNCNTHITIKIPGVFTSHWDCNKETDTVDIPGFKFNYSENLNSGNYNARAEVSIEKSLTLGKKGIFTGGIGASIGDFIEWNNTGMTDFGVKASAGIEAGIDTEVKVGDSKDTQHIEKSTTIGGIEAQISLKSGPSLSGEGILHGIEIKP